MKTKRRIIIREYDFEKFPKSIHKRYDAVTFKPLTKDYFQKRVTYFSLKGKEYLARQYMHYEYPESLLRKMTGVKFHKSEYQYWLVKYDDQGQLKIRAGLGQPESRLGILTYVEKNDADVAQ